MRGDDKSSDCQAKGNNRQASLTDSMHCTVSVRLLKYILNRHGLFGFFLQILWQTFAGLLILLADYSHEILSVNFT